MEYFAGLAVSMEETHVCVVTRDGAVVHEVKVPSTPASIATGLAQAPTCQRIAFETGRTAPMLYHGLSQLGLAVVCVESRQAYQALKSLATHKTDRDDARGLAHHPTASILLKNEPPSLDPLENTIGWLQPMSQARSARPLAPRPYAIELRLADVLGLFQGAASG